jgi:hypothetical protein
LGAFANVSEVSVVFFLGRRLVLFILFSFETGSHSAQEFVLFSVCHGMNHLLNRITCPGPAVVTNFVTP